MRLVGGYHEERRPPDLNKIDPHGFQCRYYDGILNRKCLQFKLKIKLSHISKYHNHLDFFYKCAVLHTSITPQSTVCEEWENGKEDKWNHNKKRRCHLSSQFSPRKRMLND